MEDVRKTTQNQAQGPEQGRVNGPVRRQARAHGQSGAQDHTQKMDYRQLQVYGQEPNNRPRKKKKFLAFAGCVVIALALLFTGGYTYMRLNVEKTTADLGSIVKLGVYNGMNASVEQALFNNQTDAVSDWAVAIVDQTLEGTDQKLTDEERERVKSKVNDLVEETIKSGNIVFNDDNQITDLSKSYLANAVSSAVAYMTGIGDEVTILDAGNAYYERIVGMQAAMSQLEASNNALVKSVNSMNSLLQQVDGIDSGLLGDAMLDEDAIAADLDAKYTDAYAKAVNAADDADGANGEGGSNGSNGAGGSGNEGSNGAGLNGSGSNGSNGSNSSNGTNGSEFGNSGSNGTNSSGSNGSNGNNSNGTSGANGSNGSSGANSNNTNSSNGTSGANGSNGSNGTNGADGAGVDLEAILDGLGTDAEAIQKLREAIEALSAEQQNILNQLQSNSEQITEIVTQLTSNTELIKSNSTEIDNLKSALSTLQNDLNETTTSIENAKTELGNTIESTKSELDSTIDSAKNELQSNIDKTNSDLDSAKTELNSTIDTTKSELTSTIEADKKELSENIDNTKNELIENLSKINEDLQKDIADKKADSDQKIESLQNALQNFSEQTADTFEKVEDQIEQLGQSMLDLEEALNAKIDGVESNLLEKMEEMGVSLTEMINDNTSAIDNMRELVSLYMTSADGRLKVATIHDVAVRSTEWQSLGDGRSSAVIKNPSLVGAYNVQVNYAIQYNLDPTYSVNAETGELTITISSGCVQNVTIDSIIILYFSDENTLDAVSEAPAVSAYSTDPEQQGVLEENREESTDNDDSNSDGGTNRTTEEVDPIPAE